MVSITRNVSDIPASDLSALEHIIGAPLRPNQQVLVQVVEREPTVNGANPKIGEAQLPEWCNVYEGLSDQEIAELEKAFRPLRLRNESR